MRMRKRIATTTLLTLLVLAAPAAGATDESELFPRPAPLQPSVAFWTRVYAEVGTDGGLIHDTKHLDVVYEVIRLPRGLSSRTRERRIEAAKKRYVKILRRLAQGRRSDLNSDELRVLALWPGDVSNETLRRAAGRVRFQLGQAEKFREGLVRAGAWQPHIRRVFAAEGVPEQLTALPHVESSYNPRAVSKAGAAGMWQFTHGTGRRYLRIDSAVDERFDPFLSSEAAAALLRDNYERTGAWPLAITAYNHGSAGMRRAVRQLGTRDIATIVARYRSRSFGFASRNFYTEFLAALDVSREAERHFGPLEAVPPADHEVVVLDSYYAPQALARAFGVDIDLLRELNPGLRSTVWRGQKHVPKGYTLRLPRVPGQSASTTLLASIPGDQRFGRQRPDRNYRVRRGDTLSKIAHRFGVSQRSLARANGLRNRHRIRVGQVLRIPGRHGRPTTVARAPARVAPKPAPPREATHYRVRRGDSLSLIASRFGVSETKLARVNGLRNRNRIHVGQTLTIPGTAQAAASGTRAESPGAKASGAQQATAPAVARSEPEASEAQQATAPAVARSEPEASEAQQRTRAESPGADASEGPQPAELTPPDVAPGRYAVAHDGTIVAQPEETLGHVADWLGISTGALRRLNGLGRRTPLALGRRLRLDFTRVPRDVFEQRRLAHHRAIREDFFRRHRVAGTQNHVLRRGETLWELSRKRYGLPLWLVADYNPEIDLKRLHPGVRLRIPRVERRS